MSSTSDTGPRVLRRPVRIRVAPRRHRSARPEWALRSRTVRYRHRIGAKRPDGAPNRRAWFLCEFSPVGRLIFPMRRRRVSPICWTGGFISRRRRGFFRRHKVRDNCARHGGLLPGHSQDAGPRRGRRARSRNQGQRGHRTHRRECGRARPVPFVGGQPRQLRDRRRKAAKRSAEEMGPRGAAGRKELTDA